MTTSFELTLRNRRWRGLATSGGIALTAFAIQFTGINRGLQLLVATVFIFLAIFAYVRSTMERLGDIKPSWPETMAYAGGNRRDLPESSLAAHFDLTVGTLTLDEQITMLAQVCGEFGRHVGVMDFRFRISDRDTLERAVSALRAGIRRTDLLERVSEEEIVVCLTMIHDVRGIECVARRLARSLEQRQIDRADWAVGCAISPVHGYTGADLIDFAARART